MSEEDLRGNNLTVDIQNPRLPEGTETMQRFGYVATEVLERRQSLRYDTHYPVQCDGSEGSFSARVCDLSRDGMRLEVGTSLAVGTRLTLAGLPQADFLGGRRVEGKVVWSAGEQVGVSLDAPLPLDNWVDDSKQQRAALRFRASFRVVLHDVRNRMLGGGTCIDFGVDGMQLSCLCDLSPGQLVQISVTPHDAMPPLKIMARVRWLRGSGHRVAGLRFVAKTMETAKLLEQYAARCQTSGTV